MGPGKGKKEKGRSILKSGSLMGGKETTKSPDGRGRGINYLGDIHIFRANRGKFVGIAIQKIGGPKKEKKEHHHQKSLGRQKEKKSLGIRA